MADQFGVRAGPDRVRVLAWNRGQQALFGGFEQVPPAVRNVLGLMFMSPELRAPHADRERGARPEFSALWECHDLVGYAPRSRTFVHPRHGRLTLDHVKMHAADGAPTLVAHLLPPGSAVAAGRCWFT
ncbi:hypothetical protein ACFY00_17285 [Kitasatospora sp. NPDC001540]|uniref:MmyB family transcriptional regulator n=1 Tax=Kitasatospora sp. NPDC001540 TaxID=3364014 RepID=UPI0036C00747